jgi:hypothetical protein
MRESAPPMATKDPEHTHLSRVPEPLEKIFGELGEIARAAGPAASEEAARVRAILTEALAAEARGDKASAVGGVMRAMQALAALVGRLDPKEGGDMHAIARQFTRALGRGDAGEARAAADAMRDRAGAKVVKE